MKPDKITVPVAVDIENIDAIREACRRISAAWTELGYAYEQLNDAVHGDPSGGCPESSLMSWGAALIANNQSGGVA